MIKGQRFENGEVAGQFLKHFQGFLGTQDVVKPFSQFNGIFDTTLSHEEALEMITEVTEKEMKDALFNIEDEAPGPDGFTSKIFCLLGYCGKRSLQSSERVFTNGRLLGEVNATIIFHLSLRLIPLTVYLTLGQ